VSVAAVLLNKADGTEEADDGEDVVIIVPRKEVTGAVLESTNQKLIITDNDGNNTEITTTPEIGPRIPIYEIGEEVTIPYRIYDDGKFYYDGPTPETI
jgi:hypothetical protein